MQQPNRTTARTVPVRFLRAALAALVAAVAVGLASPSRAAQPPEVEAGFAAGGHAG